MPYWLTVSECRICSADRATFGKYQTTMSGNEGRGKRTTNEENVKVMSFYDLENILRWNHNELKWCWMDGWMNWSEGSEKNAIQPTTHGLIHIFAEHYLFTFIMYIFWYAPGIPIPISHLTAAEAPPESHLYLLYREQFINYMAANAIDCERWEFLFVSLFSRSKSRRQRRRNPRQLTCSR